MGHRHERCCPHNQEIGQVAADFCVLHIAVLQLSKDPRRAPWRSAPLEGRVRYLGLATLLQCVVSL